MSRDQVDALVMRFSEAVEEGRDQHATDVSELSADVVKQNVEHYQRVLRQFQIDLEANKLR